MKFLEKLSLILFSIIISIISIILILIIFKVVNLGVVAEGISMLLSNEKALKITLGVTIVSLLLAIKCLFFSSSNKDDGRNGITLENNSGKLVISKESLETLIANVVKEVQGIEAVASRTVLEKDNSLVVYVSTLVSKDMLIKEVSTEIQQRIKETLSRTADLEVKQVNIKVKNITNKKIKGLPSPSNEEKNENVEIVEENNDAN